MTVFDHPQPRKIRIKEKDPDPVIDPDPDPKPILIPIPLDPVDFGIIMPPLTALFSGIITWDYIDNCTEVIEYHEYSTFDEKVYNCIMFAVPAMKYFKKPIKKRRCDLMSVTQKWILGICYEEVVQFTQHTWVTVDTSIPPELIKTLYYVPLLENVTSFHWWDCLSYPFLALSKWVWDMGFIINVGTDGVSLSFGDQPEISIIPNPQGETVVNWPTGESISVEVADDGNIQIINEKDPIILTDTPSDSQNKPMKFEVSLIPNEKEDDGFIALSPPGRISPNIEIKASTELLIMTGTSDGGTAVWLTSPAKGKDYQDMANKFVNLISDFQRSHNDLITFKELKDLLGAPTLRDSVTPYGINLTQGTYDQKLVRSFVQMLDIQIEKCMATKDSLINLENLKQSIHLAKKTTGVGTIIDTTYSK